MRWDDLFELGVNDAYYYFIRFIKELLDIYDPLKEVAIPRKYAIRRAMDNSWTTKILLHTG